jgi:hypothetical protein
MHGERELTLRVVRYSDVSVGRVTVGTRPFRKDVLARCQRTATSMDIPPLAHTTFDDPVHGSAMIPAETLKQIQFLLGHVSVQTSERYIGCKQRLRVAVTTGLASSQGELVSPQVDA